MTFSLLLARLPSHPPLIAGDYPLGDSWPLGLLPRNKELPAHDQPCKRNSYLLGQERVTTVNLYVAVETPVTPDCSLNIAWLNCYIYMLGHLTEPGSRDRMTLKILEYGFSYRSSSIDPSQISSLRSSSAE